MTRHQYRSDLGIISDILSVTMDGGSQGTMISSISRRANMSNDVIITKCERLRNAGLIESRRHKRNHTFIITEKGIEFFQQLQKFIELVREVKIRY
ncbi:MAG: transcriptional regulator [Thaumarchaeota archaeon]|nr:transcriptional regulator [Nitrososphaerota archaeon]